MLKSTALGNEWEGDRRPDPNNYASAYSEDQPQNSSSIPTGAGPAEQPAPPRIPDISLLHQEEERVALLKKLHALVEFQLKRHCERRLPRWRGTAQYFDEAASLILEDCLDISPNTEIEELREWIIALRNRPKKLAFIYNEYIPPAESFYFFIVLLN